MARPSARPKVADAAPRTGVQALVWEVTPVGPLWAEVSGPANGQGALTALHWGKAPAGSVRVAGHPAFAQLNDYFNKTSEHFDVQTEASGTSFQKQVWSTIACIPYGTVATYADIARHLGSHPRAVASACARNPLPLFIPCHRVIASDGQLRGYSGGDGVPTKRLLLELEGWHPAG